MDTEQLFDLAEEMAGIESDKHLIFSDDYGTVNILKTSCEIQFSVVQML